MQIGDIADGEIDAVVELWRRCGLLRPWNDPYRDIDLARRSLDATILVGRRGNLVVASTLLGFDGHRGWLYYVAVDPDCRGEGLGRSLIEAAEAWLIARGAPKVQLLVRSTNDAVVGFYEGLGYTDQDCVVLGKFFPQE